MSLPQRAPAAAGSWRAGAHAPAMSRTDLAPLVVSLGVALGCGAPHATTAGAEASTAQTTVALDEPFQIEMGQQIETATGLRIRFDAVRADSRCPRGVTCVWAGDAVVALTVEADDGPVETELHTHPSRETTADVAGHRITLQGLAPEPEDGTTIDASDYRAALVVTRES